MFLLDTVVLSELRKPLRQRNPNLVYWIEAISSRDLFVSVVTVGEIERGIERQRQPNPQFAARLTAWLDAVLRTYEGRILPVDIAVARRIVTARSAIKVLIWRLPQLHLNMASQL